MPALAERVQHFGLQYYGSTDVTWLTIPTTVILQPAVEAPVKPLDDVSRIRATYARLARQYDARPRVADSGGGLPGEVNQA